MQYFCDYNSLSNDIIDINDTYVVNSLHRHYVEIRGDVICDIPCDM